jgi:hypothetical protein
MWRGVQTKAKKMGLIILEEALSILRVLLFILCIYDQCGCIYI